MDDRKLFQETFSHLHASENDLNEVRARILSPDVRHARLSRRAVSLLLAAVLLLALAVTAYAVGLGFHRREAQLIREQLMVEEHHIASYTEAALPERIEPGITLLSVYNNGGGLNVYFTVSPVAEEDVRGMFQQDMEADGRTHYILYLVSVGEHEGLLARFYTPGDWDYLPGEQIPWVDENGNELMHITEEGKRRRWLGQAYDPETQSLMLTCGILGTLLPEGESFELHAASYDFWAYPDENNNLALDLQHNVHQDFGSVTVPIPEADTRTLCFSSPTRFENPEYEGTGALLGAEISVSGITWLVHIDDPAAGYRPDDANAPRLTQEQYLRQFSWTNRMAEVIADAVLRFDDGSELPCPGFDSYSTGEDLVLRLSGGGWPGTIDLTQLLSLTVAGQSFPLQ